MKIVAEEIEALVWFRGRGKPSPYRFRYRERDGSFRVVSVGQVLSAEEEKIAGVRSYLYRCQSEIGRAVVPYELKYYIQECRWVLYKM